MENVLDFQFEDSSFYYQRLISCFSQHQAFMYVTSTDWESIGKGIPMWAAPVGSLYRVAIRGKDTATHLAVVSCAEGSLDDILKHPAHVRSLLESKNSMSNTEIIYRLLRRLFYGEGHADFNTPFIGTILLPIVQQ